MNICIVSDNYEESFQEYSVLVFQCTFTFISLEDMCWSVIKIFSIANSYWQEIFQDYHTSLYC